MYPSYSDHKNAFKYSSGIVLKSNWYEYFFVIILGLCEKLTFHYLAKKQNLNWVLSFCLSKFAKLHHCNEIQNNEKWRSQNTWMTTCCVRKGFSCKPTKHQNENSSLWIPEISLLLLGTLITLKKYWINLFL